MNNTAFKTDQASDFIVKALDDFLRDKNLTISNQQYERLKKLLMVRLLDEEMSYNNAYRHLSEIVEYRKDYEISANAPDEAEEEMIRIIGSADVKTVEVEVSVEVERYKNRFFVTLALLGLTCAVLAYSMTKQYMSQKKIEVLAMAQVINSDEENVIKGLVQKVVTSETKNGNEITHSAVYKDMKELESIQALGEARSYKKFNKSQYNVAVDYLNGRISALGNTAP